MAVKIPDYPWKLDENQLYHDLYDEYVDEKTTWVVNDLYKKYPALFLDQCLRYKVLVPVSEELLIPGFNDPESTSGKILTLVENQCRSYLELSDNLPKVLTQTQSLKHNIAFLCNFRQIEYFTIPTSGRTFIAKEGAEYAPPAIDEFYDLANHLEVRFQYRIDFDDVLHVKSNKTA